jgi:RNA ligase (TIGR02306 family)
MTERALATIRNIDSIHPIEGADKIERAQIGGWNVVVLKDQFVAGDTCIYCEIDSVLPDKPEFGFLKDKKFRIKTIRMRGVLSQGICFGTDILPKGTKVVIGEDVTELLGIKKYEPYIPAQLAGKIEGSFPSCIPKTDEERVQNLTNYLCDYKEVDFIPTEKLDGTSASYSIIDDKFTVCSRNLALKEDGNNMYWKMANKYNIEERLRQLKEATAIEYAIQGEIIGEGIQKNHYQIKGNRIYIFGMFNITENKYVDYPTLKTLISDMNSSTFESIMMVPEVGKPTRIKCETIDDMNKLIKLGDGISFLNPKVIREGVIFRSIENYPMINRLGKVSFKVLSNEYLLKNE